MRGRLPTRTSRRPSTPPAAPATRILGGLSEPQPARVLVDDHGLPSRIDGRAVEAVRETWQVEEGWWTERPIRRRYHEVVLADGRLLTLYQNLIDGSWHRQQGN